MPKTLTLSLPDEASTAAPGAHLAHACGPGDVIALQGDLGAETEVPGPTFTLVQTCETPALAVWHFDLYRLESAGEAREPGLDAAMDNLTLLEWPERLGQLLSATRLEVRLSFEGDGRIARLADYSGWSMRIDGDWR